MLFEKAFIHSEVLVRMRKVRVQACALEKSSVTQKESSTEARRGHLVPRKYSCTSILKFQSGMHFHSEIPLWNALPF